MCGKNITYLGHGDECIVTTGHYLHDIHILLNKKRTHRSNHISHLIFTDCLFNTLSYNIIVLSQLPHFCDLDPNFPPVKSFPIECGERDWILACNISIACKAERAVNKENGNCGLDLPLCSLLSVCKNL